MVSLPDLHDATLKDLTFEWETATIMLTFSVGTAPPDRAVVKAEGVTDLKCPRLMPWGPSNSVNSMALEAVAGRQITISCSEVSVDQASE